MPAKVPPVGVVRLSEVRVRTPCDPSKMICLWNNFHELAAKLGSAPPDEPLYLLKAPSAFAAHGDTIRRPKSYDGKIVYEGELSIVIGRRCSYVSEAEARDYIFGYSCINDVTAADLISKTPAFPQWTRAKSFDTFGAFGPVIATGLDPAMLRVRTILNSQERQNYPVSDMIFPPAKLVSLLSRDMTLCPRRRHRLRHFGWRRHDERAHEHDRSVDRRGGHAQQYLRSINPGFGQILPRYGSATCPCCRG